MYGTKPNLLNGAIANNTRLTEHEITLSNLKPSTRYYYSFGSSDTPLRAAPDQFFRTAPKPGATDAIRIWALGDFGNSSEVQRTVRDAVVKATAEHRPDLWLMLGDNAYASGKDEEFQEHLFDEYQPTFLANTPFYAIPGNHDYSGKIDNRDIPYFHVFSFPQYGEAGGVPSGSKSYYAVNYGNVHIVALDSYGKLEDRKRIYETSSRQIEWLRRDLAANRLPWTIVLFHHPPYTKGSHDSDKEELLVKIRENLVPILEQYHVDLVLSGHSHVYERTHQLYGHYGLAESFTKKMIVGMPSDSIINTYRSPGKAKGPIYIVAGSGGQLGGQSKGYPLPAAAVSNNTDGGSILLDVTGNQMVVRWLCGDGVVRDQFTIQKK